MKSRLLPMIVAIAALAAADVSLAQPGPPSRPPPPVGSRHPTPPPPPPPHQPGPGHWDYRWDRLDMRHGPRWQRHVRACRARYRTYNPRRDAYRAHRGVWVRCRL